MPAFATLNGAPVVLAEVCLPARGTWTASLVLDTDQPPTGAVMLALSEGAVQLVGTVVEGGEAHGRGEVRIVGGAGQLGAVVPARAYRAASVRTVVVDLLAAVGERLSPASDLALLAQPLTAWTVAGGPVSEALQHLCDALGALWRVTAAGEVALLPLDATAPTAARGEVLRELPAEGCAELALDALNLYPGETWQERRVSHVQHSISRDAIRTRAWLDGRTTDRLWGALRAAVLRVVSRFDYFGAYPCEVRGQNDDGTLELRPDAPWLPWQRRWPGLSKVPVRGLPGVTVKVRKGARVLLTFEGGDPGRPMATLFEGHSLESLTITATDKVIVTAPVIYLADEEGAQPLARVGDLVEVVLPPLTTFTGSVIPAPPGSPVAGTLTFLDTAQGYITSGSDRAKAAG